jgi:hypothetical protein
MKLKALELRDAGTFIPLLCVDMNPGRMGTPVYGAQRYLLRRCGYACDGHPNILMTRLDGDGPDGARATNKAYEWGESVRRTFGVAHNYIIKHWHDLHDGDVVDVEWILGETKQKKISERVTEPL